MTSAVEPDGQAEDGSGAGADPVPQYELTLFVSGGSELSARVIGNARELCDVHLGGRYRLTIVDINEDADAAAASAVLAVPTLVRTEPPPRRAFIGDLSHLERVLTLLRLPPDPAAPAPLAG